MITVLGATGNVGSQVVRELTAAGVDVRAVARRPAVAAPGVRPWPGDLGDRTFLRRAFDGATAAFVLLPFDVTGPDHAAHQARLGESVVAALRDAAVSRVVALSSLGAEVPGGPGLAATGYLGSLHDQEARLATLDAHVTRVRPGLFLESFLWSADAMRAYGVHADSVDPDVALPMVATRDVGRAAAAALLDPDAPDVVEVQGAADRTVPDVVAALGPALGLPDLAYVRVPDGEMERLLRGAGLSADGARLHVAMNRAFNEGRVRAHGPRGAADGVLTVEEWAAGVAG
ncbi:NmrA family NAD(P)-binding protein [Pseudonocardia alni]|uniref:NmrA family NAD(P)-binding protein n=1 Tax=Pseudonocardia alni TaxID=33907 RepID=UPI001AD72619|nr:NAD(P)H-binding protein [Pseudonocardia alni]MBO4238422.1 NAD(P)H-binding protein [Pseudonocardia alni]